LSVCFGIDVGWDEHVSEYVLVARKILELRQDHLKLRFASELKALSFSEKKGRMQRMKKTCPRENRKLK
jgi:hypothetical protein